MHKVEEILEKAIQLFRDRNEVYQDDFLHFGRMMQGMFPEGVRLETVEEWNRLGVFFYLCGKLSRYAKNFSDGGHTDSARDAIVYAAILTHLTGEDEG